MTEIKKPLLTGEPDVAVRRRTLAEWATAVPWPLRLLAPLVAMAGIFWFSAQPFTGPELPWWEVVARKLGHFSSYAGLAALWAWALAPRVRTASALKLAALISVLYAASDEFHQSFVEGRHGTPVDVGIDSLGAATAIVVVALAAGRRS